MSMKLGVNILGKLLKSGEAIGAEMKLTEITELAAKNSASVGRQIGEFFGQKGKDTVRMLEESGSFDEITARINELAQKYPEAAVKLGIKQSKQGYTVVKASVKNGEQTLLNQAISLTKDGTVKTRGTINGTTTRSYSDIATGNMTSIAEKGALRAEVNGNLQNVTINLTEGGNNVLSAQVRQGGLSAGTQVGYESVDGLSYFNFGKNGFGVSGIYDNAAMTRIIKQETKETSEALQKIMASVSDAKGDGKPMTLALQILRPLRERFNTAVDLFRYNGKTNFERFLSRSELKSELAKLAGEEKNISQKIAEALKNGKIKEVEMDINQCSPQVREALAYREQIRTDINRGRELISICC